MENNSIEIWKVLPAWFALIFSSLSLVVSVLSFKVAKRKEERSLPNIAFYHDSGFTTAEVDGSRSYKFAMSLTNRSEASSSIIMIEGILLGITKTGVDISLRIPCAVDNADASNPLKPGAKIAAGETLAGRISFVATPHMLKSLFKIERFRISVTDGFGEQYLFNPGPLREINH